MIGYKQSQNHSGDKFEDNRHSPVQSEGKLSLTKIWEIVIKTKRLPDDFDLNTVFQAVRDRLRDPEREVRQHALRFLSDLIPVTRVTLDDYMRLLLPDLLANLGHPAPALRKGALDTLRTYLRHSTCYDDLLKKILSMTDDLAVLTAAPFLITTDNADGTLFSVVDRLWRNVAKNQNNYQQEISLQALTRIRSILGDERFKHLLGSDRLVDFQKLCDTYGLPAKTPLEEDDNGEKRLFWSNEEIIEDKVILETEITLKTGPAITMQIHEESRPNSVIGGAVSSEEDSRRDVGVIRVLADDSESDFYEEARRTPRKVRFGGESVKVRTPESDSSNTDEKPKNTDDTLRITVTNAVSIKTRKSLIPIRITSEPPSPKKHLPFKSKNRLHKSSPNLLNRTNSLSRIPLRRTSSSVQKYQVSQKQEGAPQKVTKETKAEQHNEEANTNNSKSVANEAHIISEINKNTTIRPATGKNKPRRNSISPIPVHNEIQILHNLTRSPERVRKESVPSEEIQKTLKQIDKDDKQVLEEHTEYSNSSTQTTENQKIENQEENDSKKQETVLENTTQLGNVEEKSDSFVSHQESRPKVANHRISSGIKNIENYVPAAQIPVDSEINSNQAKLSNQNKVLSTQRISSAIKNTDNYEPTVDSKINSNLAKLSNQNKVLSTQRISSAMKNTDNYGPTVDSKINSNQVKLSNQNVLSTQINEEQNIVKNENGFYHSFQVCRGRNGICGENQQKWGAGNDSESRSTEKFISTPHNLHESLTTSSVNSEEDLWAKSEALDNLIKMLKQPGTCENLEPGPAALLFEALFASQRRDRLHSLADLAFSILIQGIRDIVLEKCLGRITFGICRMGAPRGLRLALDIVKKFPTRKLVDEILNSGFQHRTREGALQILMGFSRLLPSADLSIARMTEFAAHALRDRRRRVRQAALEALACFAPLRSNSDVLNVVRNVAEDCADCEEIMQVVRTRLSRRQLPIVDQDGTVRYTTPRDITETEFLSGHSFREQPRPHEVLSPPPSSSSGSSGTASVNYWRQNMRRLQSDPSFSIVGSSFPSLSEDDTNLEHSQIWAVDPSPLLKKAKNIKEVKTTVANPAVLRPVYLLQPPETAKIGGRGHRRYDRGRSISPPKPPRGQFSEPSTTSANGGQTTYDGDAENSIEVFNNTSTSQNASTSSIHRRFLYREGFRKSFSSEQLYFKDKVQSDYQTYSLSSRSSSTSTTGSSTKSGTWHRDFRSGIPVPISSETKLKIRTSHSQKVGSSIGGPLIARRSPPHSKIIQRSPTPSHEDPSVPTIVPLKSYDSESSEYYTPPPDTDQAFVKINTVETISLGPDDDGPHNNNTQDCVDSYVIDPPEYNKTPEPEQRPFSRSSPDASDAIRKEILKTPPSRFVSSESLHDNNNIEIIDATVTKQSRQSSGNSVRRVIQNLDDTPCVGESKFKSKSVHDLQNFLPEIVTRRKNVSSAPPINIDGNFNVLHTPEPTHRGAKSPVLIPSEKTMLPSSLTLDSSEELPSTDGSVTLEPSVDQNEPIPSVEVSAGSGSKRLVRRFNRSQSIRRSVKESQRVELGNQIESSLKPFGKPKDALDQALSQMNSNEWETSILGLQGLSRIANHHPEIIENQIHTVCVNLAKHVKNLRSQVARTACHTATEVFSHCRKGLDMEVEEIVGPLLQRTADTNKFLRADANSALDVMCEKLPLHRVVTVITTKGCTHQNPIVRATSGRLLTDLVKRLGSEKILQLPKDVRDRILLAGTKSLTDGNLETRSYGKAMMGRLLGHSGFSKALHEAVPQNVLRHAMKAFNCLTPIT